MLVSTVTAMTSGRARPARGRGAPCGVRRRAHHRGAAGGVHVDHPDAERVGRRDGRRRRCSGCRGTSDRGTRGRRGPTSSRTMRRSFAREQAAADLEAADDAAQRVGEAQRLARRSRRRARRGADPCLAPAAAVSTVPTRSCSRVDAVPRPCSRVMPSSSFGQMNGSTKFAVPTCTAFAPAMHELERVVARRRCRPCR